MSLLELLDADLLTRHTQILIQCDLVLAKSCCTLTVNYRSFLEHDGLI